MMYSLGKLSRDGEFDLSSIEFSAGAEVSDLNFHISSSIGEVILQLNKEGLKDQVKEIEVLDTGARPLVPSVYKPLSPESACTEQFIYVKFERDDSKIKLDSDIKVLFTFVDSYNYLKTENSYHYHHFLERNKDFYGMDIQLNPDYIRNGSEVQAIYKQFKQSRDDVKKYVTSVSKIVHSVIRPPVPVEYVMFHDEVGVFQETVPDIDIDLPDKLADYAISCSAFGVPKPKITILDPSKYLYVFNYIYSD